jgi:hypothetical protein
MEIVLIVSAIVFIIVVAYASYSLYVFLISQKNIVFSPGEVHMLVGQQVTVYALLYRKKSGSYRSDPSADSREAVFTNPASSVYQFQEASPARVKSTGGIASISIKGTKPGSSALVGEADSSTGKKYGPKTIQVHVYADQASVPSNVTLTLSDKE